MKFLIFTVIGMLSLLFSCNGLYMLLPQTIDSTSYINNIFETTMDCILPCVMGLQVGDEPDDDILSRLGELEAMGGIREVTSGVATYFIATEPQGGFTTSIHFQSERIQAIALDLSSPEDWLSSNPFTFDELLTQIGNPDEIYVIFLGPPAGYTLLLVYESERIAFRYSFTVEVPERFDGDPIPFCTLESPITNLNRLSISVPGSDNDDWLLDVVPDLFDERDTRPWRMLNDLTVFDPTNLLSSLSSETECVDLTTFEALQELGYQY